MGVLISQKDHFVGAAHGCHHRASRGDRRWRRRRFFKDLVYKSVNFCQNRRLRRALQAIVGGQRRLHADRPTHSVGILGRGTWVGN